VCLLQGLVLNENVIGAAQVVVERDEVGDGDVNLVVVVQEAEGVLPPQILEVLLFRPEVEGAEVLLRVHPVHVRRKVLREPVPRHGGQDVGRPREDGLVPVACSPEKLRGEVGNEVVEGRERLDVEGELGYEIDEELGDGEAARELGVDVGEEPPHVQNDPVGLQGGPGGREQDGVVQKMVLSLLHLRVNEVHGEDHASEGVADVGDLHLVPHVLVDLLL